MDKCIYICALFTAKTQNRMKSFLMEFFNSGENNRIIYVPVLSISMRFLNLDQCIKESERIKAEYGYALCKISE